MDIPIQSGKQQDLLSTAKKLFWKYGVKKVSIEEICREANVSKMTFYKFFPNKPELAKTILNESLNASINKFNEIVASDIPFSKKLEAIFIMKIEAVGNFSKEFINDIYSNPGLGLQQFLEEKSNSFRNEVINFYKKAQTRGEIRKEVNIDFILVYSTQMTKLMEDETLMAQYKTPVDFILEVMNLLFYGIVTK